VGVLAGVPPFDRYPPVLLAPLAVHADRLRLRDGTVVAREGRWAREVAVVVAGVLLAHRGDRPIGLFGPGTWVGAGELLDDRPHPVTLVAGEGLEVLVVTGPAYRWAVQTLPGLAERRVLDLRTAQAALERQEHGATFAG
jgi:CRP-like cAMP-binding protein